MPTTIDLNCDLGESFGAYRLGQDEELLSYISSANIACGWHAGDPMVMDSTVKLARERGVAVGAHPSYPDLLGFGRRYLECSPAEIRNYLIYQIGALNAFCRAHGVRLTHVKPHGSLYNQAAENEKLAAAILEAIARVDENLYYFALAGPQTAFLKDLGYRMGVRVIYEAFPDRAYTPQGTLVSRKEPGAVIHDHELAAKRALSIAQDGVVKAINGAEISMCAQTLCIHGDNPQALDLVRSIRSTLTAAGITIAPPRGE